MPNRNLATVGLLALLFATASAPGANATADRVMLYGHVPSAVAALTPKGRVPATNQLALAIGVPLRNEAALDDLLQALYDPQSASFHKFLTLQEFTVRFGPTEQDYEAVIAFAEANGLAVSGKHPNRVVLDVKGAVSNVERAFGITLRTYRHPTEGRDFFAPDIEPSVPTNLPVADMWGLSDYGLPRPLWRKVDPQKATPLNYNGSGPGGAYQGMDFRNAYAPGASLTGSGQVAAVAEFDGYYAADIATYESQCGYSNVPLQNVLVDNVSGIPGYSGDSSAVIEVSLDIEVLISMAPGLSKLIVYEGNSPYDVFNRIVTDNSAKQISCSWFWRYGPTHTWVRRSPSSTLDSQLKQMAAQGQSFFEASGDSDAYTGSQAFSSFGGPIPMDSVYVTSVGGTSLTMNGAGSSWSSETVWNWGGNVGTGGGISPNYARPSWQANVSMAANGGSTANRNIPDVALTADAVNVVYGNGNSEAVGGTSCAAPLWAGFCALINQQSVAGGGTTMGLLNPALYAIAATPNYTNCFHDITTGNNIGNYTPGLFNAVSNYDLCTGLGTPNGTNLINTLAPPAVPYFITQPVSQAVAAGSSLTFSASAGGRSPLKYQWLFNGTNLPGGSNISGTTSNVLSLTAVTANNAGSYQVVVTNNSASATSAVAILTVNRLSSSVTLLSSVNPSGYMDNLNFAANVIPASATGTIQFFANGAAFDLQMLAAGQAVSTNLSSLPRGINSIVAAYSGDANYLPSSNSLAQVVTNHPPTAAPAFYNRVAGTLLDIAVADLATNWTDVDGDSIWLAGLSISTNGVTLTYNAGTLVYFNPNNVADQFSCIISDGFGGTNTQTVSMAIVAPASSPPNFTGVAVNPDGSFTLNLTGTPSDTYVLEATLGVIPPGDWQPIATNTLDISGIWQFTDTQAASLSQRFYRLKLAQ
jgi:subtilase family serine protease